MSPTAAAAPRRLPPTLAQIEIELEAFRTGKMSGQVILHVSAGAIQAVESRTRREIKGPPASKG